MMKTVLSYISNQIFPVLIPIFLASLVFVVISLQTLRSDVDYAQKDIERISREHHGRIMANLISNRETQDGVTAVSERMTRAEVSITQMCEIQSDMEKMRKEMYKLNSKISVLVDRSSRKK